MIHRRGFLAAAAALPLSAQDKRTALEAPKPAPQAPSEPELPAGPISSFASAPAPYNTLRWRMQYEFADADADMVINDFHFASPERGIAAVSSGTESKQENGVLITRDGGKTWNRVKVKGVPISVFMLDDSRGWLITSDGIYYTTESGARWEKRKRPAENILRVYFADENRGWAFGGGKIFWWSKDGGKTWAKVPESEKLEVTSENTVLRFMDFVGTKRGMLVGNSTPRRDRERWPDWMMPENALRRKQLPGSIIALESTDSGATWSPRMMSAFGQVARLRSVGLRGLLVLRYGESFSWPSEVLLLDYAKGLNAPIFRRKNLNVTDALPLTRGGVMIAAVEPPGKLIGPVPGKVHVFYSPDNVAWFELRMHYRALGRRAFLAQAGDRLWLATDEGQILHLQS